MIRACDLYNTHSSRFDLKMTGNGIGQCGVVPFDPLEAEVDKWCAKLPDKRPTALKMRKYVFPAGTGVFKEQKVNPGNDSFP